jgi:hypothetical protein
MLVSRYINGVSGAHFNARRGLVLKLHFQHYKSTLAHYKAFQHGVLALPDFYDSLVILGYQFSLYSQGSRTACNNTSHEQQCGERFHVAKFSPLDLHEREELARDSRVLPLIDCRHCAVGDFQ